MLPGAPRDPLSANTASIMLFVLTVWSVITSITSLSFSSSKKNPLGDSVRVMRTIAGSKLAGTTASRTHAPLARHLFYAFVNAEIVGVQAHYVDAIHIHSQSKSDPGCAVKFE
jgi:hypothetical protein